MAPSSKANNAKKLLLLEISYFLRTENTTKPYILKAKKFAEPPFQSKKIAEKVRKSGRKRFATNARKSSLQNFTPKSA